MAQSEQRGEARGEARAILAVLVSRKLPISNEQREQILGCKDLVCLDRWISRAALVDNTESLFDPR